MPQLDSTYFLSQVFWLFLSFFALYFSVHFFVLPRIAKVLHLRQMKIEHDLKESESYHNQAEKIEQECAKALKEARQAAKEMVLKAEHDIKQSVENEIKNFMPELDKKEKLARLDLEKIKESLQNSVDELENELVEKICEKLTY